METSYRIPTPTKRVYREIKGDRSPISQIRPFTTPKTIFVKQPNINYLEKHLKATIEEVANRKAISQILTSYHLDNKERVEDYVQDFPELKGFLIELPQNVKKFFPNSTLSLEVVNDPDVPTEELLAIYVVTSDSPDSASEKMEQLFFSEWGNNIHSVSEHLFLSVKFK